VSRKELNLGILAHVDAGKTTLTERLLYETGVIDHVGSVDAGTTQTDSLALERRRGITIKAAVASFTLAGGVHVNLIDTPGHPDFIAEVERSLAVLDGAVLVVSAVEGVQPQTRILMRALQRLAVPTLFFVNKTDRMGADVERVVGEIRGRLTPAVVLLGEARDDAALAEALAEHDDALLAAYVAGAPLPHDRLRDALAQQVRTAVIHPALAGSALAGTGVRELMDAIAQLLPPAAGDPEAPLDATVFKIERSVAGEKVAFARLRSGTLNVRDRVRFGAEDHETKVTALAVFEQGDAVQRRSVSAGAVAKVWGLGEVRIGDRIGDRGAAPGLAHRFAPPMLEAAVAPRSAADRERLHVALTQLAEQDPLIGVRLERGTHDLSVSLYGEVQKEVVEATIEEEYGIPVVFQEVTPIYVERPVGRGEAVEVLHAETNPYLATIGLRVDPAPAESGVEFRLKVDHTGVPLYAYKNLDRFSEAMRHYVLEGLRAGVHGWQVADCVVTLIECAYSVPDGPPSRRGPLSSPADFRKLTPIVLGQALARAGTVVCEPMMRIAIEAPARSVGVVAASVGQLGGTVDPPGLRDELATVEALLPAARAHDLQRRLANVTRGEATIETAFGGYRPVTGVPPTRG
jgi:ribosomal protection tetracycline resistance protein